MNEPEIEFVVQDYTTESRGDSLYCKESYLKRDTTGIWELYVTGSNQHRGAMQGALTKELMRYQEDVFIDQIREIIPSDSYLGFLRVMLITFNRKLGEYIPLEYRNEIAALSQFCTHEYDAIGTPYERQLNYHAAHDIGHTMQQYMLVGCSSFGAWGDKSATNKMIIGRNFDFYVGDNFAKNKIITFAMPEKGYRYASMGWAGMIGVLSGINQKGLTVTINAAKGAIPTSAAMPISILTREILQYASTINEAFEIAKLRETFVSESIFVGSAKDSIVGIIEKTPESTALYVSNGNSIICTNHFQSNELKSSFYNLENIEDSDSKYRFNRVEELLESYESVDYLDVVAILRDSKGLGNKDIGVGNEMTLNQSIAHHSVIFAPQDSLMWVTTSPWQSGKIICYNLKEFFANGAHPKQDSSLVIAEDSNFINNIYPKLLNFRAKIKEIKAAMSKKESLSQSYINTFIELNENFYYTYSILAEYYYKMGNIPSAIEMYKSALECEIPYKSQREEMEEILEGLNETLEER